MADPTRLWSVLSGNVTLGPMAQRCRGVGISRMSTSLCERSRTRNQASAWVSENGAGDRATSGRSQEWLYVVYTHAHQHERALEAAVSGQ